MCSNRAIVDSVECYMDDLVECFEDFIKKSLIIISIGICIIVGMLMYLLRVVSERPPIRNVIAEGAASVHNQVRNMTMNDDENIEETVNNKTHKRHFSKDRDLSFNKELISKSKTTTGVNTVLGHGPLPNIPSFDEKMLRDVGLSSCSKLGCCSRTNSHSYIPCRVPMSSSSPPKRKSVHSIRPAKHYIPSLQICPKNIPKQGSCCSMCCNNEQS